jgi:hypothetical protein
MIAMRRLSCNVCLAAVSDVARELPQRASLAAAHFEQLDADEP